LNFAAIRGVASYHTPHDDIAHVDLRTLQHHGDNVLATLRALANADLRAQTKRQRVVL
jgi:Zn-dependent M28 family amino/carboxypeptidase